MCPGKKPPRVSQFDTPVQDWHDSKHRESQVSHQEKTYDCYYEYRFWSECIPTLLKRLTLGQWLYWLLASFGR